ncbi:hypothetical protein [uncultured Flavobacterium sp.]|uniref:hypothetical protein n=1 Tax=uncultured Flavobacterium sp. TaxID=165435 RepID=UPI001205FAEF|nr:hypothetical protein [uncultured Flavobacterium sp.]THD33334.1 MAG: hypothetical protein DI588_05200 [Flavobacterium johnsoniae]
MQYDNFYVSDEAISLDYLKSKNVTTKFVLINFASKSSLKIIPFFNTIKNEELTALLNLFTEFAINLRLDDLLGKLHIVILKILSQDDNEQMIIIHDAGFTNSSIDFLVSNLNLLKHQLQNKSVIVCPNLIY